MTLGAMLSGSERAAYGVGAMGCKRGVESSDAILPAVFHDGGAKFPGFAVKGNANESGFVGAATARPNHYFRKRAFENVAPVQVKRVAVAVGDAFRPSAGDIKKRKARAASYCLPSIVRVHMLLPSLAVSLCTSEPLVHSLDDF